ncbi:hypothetical protein SLEP1_g44673 [Rubroshorea leprosula]|uniref:F-box domain-containing protein n=1 Tax=Rubroshorea leprosula TaxID=152421 RepID=A0AAV5LHD5_9ROSI|nr:hypothetical protein SLEP1_g44673 [Rubroshorea leprosula]
MSSFPLDLSTEILRRLAVKDVFRLRCVSKLWCSLIDTPCFRKLHVSLSPKSDPNLLAIFQEDESNLIKFLDLEFPSLLFPRIIPNQPRDDTNSILGSCNGLVALCNEHRRDKSVVYGFGYDPTTADYKLLKSAHFFYKKLPKRAQKYYNLHLCRALYWKAEIYSLKTNSWREISGCPFNCGLGGFDDVAGILAENALHWLTQKYKPKPVSLRIPRHQEIAGFDLVGEEFYSVPILECFYGAFSMTMAALDGHLSVAASYTNGCVDVWVMEEYGVKESWNKTISMMQEEVPNHLIYSINDMEKFKVFPLAYSRGGDKLLVHRRGKIFWCDLKSEEAEFDDGEGVLVDGNVEITTASLVSLEDYRSEIDGKTEQIVVEDDNSNNNEKRKISQKEQEARSEDA